MERDLETIANLTQDAEERVVYMKDSMAAAQKSFTPGKHHQHEPMKHLHPSGLRATSTAHTLLPLVCTDVAVQIHCFYFRRHVYKKVIKHAG